MSRRVYVATRFAQADRARQCAAALRSGGHRIMSTWHDVALTEAEENHPDVRRVVAARNVADLRAADTIVVLALPSDAGMRGSLVEAALAWSWGHRVIIVGDRLRVTLMLDISGVTFAADVEALVSALR